MWRHGGEGERVWRDGVERRECGEVKERGSVVR